MFSSNAIPLAELNTTAKYVLSEFCTVSIYSPFTERTGVRAANKWRYIYLLVDLFNREIIGHSCGKSKDAALVYQAFASVKGDLRQIQLFHTDRGSEFKNLTIDEVINTFNIKRSLSMKGCPYDNAVAEATFKLSKAEFMRNRQFESLAQLQNRLVIYVK